MYRPSGEIQSWVSSDDGTLNALQTVRPLRCSDLRHHRLRHRHRISPCQKVSAAYSCKPQRGDQRITLRQVSTLSPGGRWLLYHGYRFPTGIALGATETRETPHQNKVQVEKVFLFPVGDVKTGLSVYFIRLAIRHVKNSFSLYRLQVMGLQISHSGECDA